jgi:thiamine-phosphate pyrophosphorylase
VLDANLNRLREALRVIEEYFRFIQNHAEASIMLKELRHSLIEMEHGFGSGRLLQARDTASDCFADVNRPEELIRKNEKDILTASFKRGQEASRVIEEYAKITDHAAFSEIAKTIRFSLYKIEKQVSGS